MRQKRAAAITTLSVSAEGVLKTIANSHVLPSGLVKRAKIILLASQGTTNQEISKEVGLHYNNVAVWRKRFSQAQPALSEVEANSPDKLEAEIKQLLSDKQRSGHPTVFTAEQVMKIINLACCKPEDYGYEVSQWSLPLLVKEIERQGIADHISEKTVSRFLKKR